MSCRSLGGARSVHRVAPRSTLAIALPLVLAASPVPAAPPTSPPPAGAAAAPAAPPVAWPRSGDLLASAKVGDWVKYRQVQVQGGQTQSGFLWHVHQGKQGTNPVLEMVLAQADASKAPPPAGAAGIQRQATPLAAEAGFQAAPVPPGVTRALDQVTATPFSALEVAGRKWSGTKYQHDLILQAPVGRITYRCELWLSPEVPVSGMLKYAMNLSGPMYGNQTLEFVTSSTHEAAAEAAVAFRSTGDLLGYAALAAEEAWRLSDPKRSRDLSIDGEVTAYRSARIRTLRIMGKGPEALQEAVVAGSGSLDGQLLQELQAEAAVAKDDVTLEKLGVSKTVLSSTRVREGTRKFATDRTPGWMDRLLTWIRGLPQPQDRSSAVHTALGVDGFPAGERTKVLALLAKDEDRLGWIKNQVWDTKRGGASYEQVEALARDFPIFAATARALAARAEALIAVGRKAEAKPWVEKYLVSTAPDRTDREAADLLALLGDPRTGTWKRKVADLAYPKLAQSTGITPPEKQAPWQYQELAALAASRGDKATALEHLPKYQRLDLRRQFELIPRLYGPGGKPAEALAWRDSIGLSPQGKADGWEFLLLGFRAECNLALAEWEFSVGNPGKAEEFVARALADGTAANQALRVVNAGRERGKLLYWRTDMSRHRNDPHHYVVEFLRDRREPDSHARIVDYLKGLGTEYPATGAVEDTWGDYVRGLAKAGNLPAYQAALAAIPRDREHNWLTGVLRETIVPITAKADLATLRRIVGLFQKPDERAELLRAALIGCVDLGRHPDAAALFADLEAAGKAGASSQHVDFGRIAMVRSLVVQGRLEEARARLGTPAPSLSEWIPIRGFAGKAWVRYVHELGIEVGRRAKGLAEATAWCKAAASPKFAAALATGMATGFHGRSDLTP